MTIAELLASTPAAGETLARHGMACVGCPMARFETLGEAAAAYRLDGPAMLREIARRQARRRRR
jgi:hybrid cluster-associated redox disulfide protein